MAIMGNLHTSRTLLVQLKNRYEYLSNFKINAMIKDFEDHSATMIFNGSMFSSIDASENWASQLITSDVVVVSLIKLRNIIDTASNRCL